MMELSLMLLLAAMDPTIIVALIAAFGPIGAYLLAARKMSGKIGTSDAEQLWAESKAIRDWSTERINVLQEEIKALRDALSSVTKRCEALEEQNENLVRELQDAHEHIATLEGR